MSDINARYFIMTFTSFPYIICVLLAPFYRRRSEYSEKLSKFPTNILNPGSQGVNLNLGASTLKHMLLLTTFVETIQISECWFSFKVLSNFLF